MRAITSLTDYVASMETQVRQRYSEKLDIVGISFEQHFLKCLEQQYVQQFTKMALSICTTVRMPTKGGVTHKWI